MNLIKWDSLLSSDLFKEFPSMDMTGWDLATDIYEKDDQLIVEMQLPGIQADSYDVSLKDGQLRVSGSRKNETETQDEQYYRKEIHRGNFERLVTLPEMNLKENEISVSHENGTLKVVIPKQ